MIQTGGNAEIKRHVYTGHTSPKTCTGRMKDYLASMTHMAEKARR